MQIRKRNGVVVIYDGSKIIRAVESAMSETELGVDDVVSRKVENAVKLEVMSSGTILTVEQVQDLVELFLAEYDRFDVAKRYVIYREERRKSRKNVKRFSLLTDEFISKYKHQPDPFPTELGKFTYYRTYSRFIPEEGRRERWWEAVARAVDFNCSLSPTTTKAEAELLYDNVYNFRQFLSGRTLFTGGTKASKLYPLSNFNCFSGDTKFLTDSGLRQFNEFSNGDTVRVLNGTGAWSESAVNCFGEQEIYELKLRRKGTKYTKIIRTTKDHKWFVRKTPSETRYDIVTTTELQEGKVLRMKRRYDKNSINMCNIGIQHGIVYGDGTYDKKMNHCRISLIGDKKDLVKFFTTGKVCTEGNRDSLCVYGLPNTWKELPNSASNVEYLKGFLYGLLLTDGAVGSSVRLHQKDKSTLELIRGMFEVIGMPTGEVREVERTNNNLGDYSNGHELVIFKEYLPKDWEGIYSEDIEPRSWVVESVTATGVYEKVYCVTEPLTNSFTLDSGIHTHNCSFSVINSFEALRDGFYLMMVGAGFGFRVLRSDVEKLPRVRKDVCIVNKQVKKVPKSQRQEITTINIKQGYIAEIVIGDDKMAWAESVRMLFEILTSSAYRNINTVLINYDHIRPKGERLKTFGGYASGEEALIKIFTKIDEVIQGSDGVEKDGKIALKPIDIMDIANIIAVGVVSGGTRRSSEICLFDIDDTDVRNAKTNLYTLKDGNWVLDDAIEHRRLSNNSIYFRSKPAYDFLAKCINDVRYSGEPGVVNEVAAAKRRPNFNGVNPCAEILLDSKGLCNLTELNVMAFVTALGEFLLDEAIKAQRMSARAGIRMNLPTLELHEWDIIAKRDNLIGCSLSGWQDMVNATGMSKEEQIRVLELLKQVAREEAESYAKELGMNAPLLVTTVKPSGTLSLLPTVSSGVHFSHSEYYIRRVRVSRHDPLAQLMIELGYPVFPEVGQEWETCDTVVVEFPVKSTGGKTKSHVSAIEQLEIYKMFMEHYVEHNVSITVHVRDNEWDAVTNWMYDNWDDVVAVSFLSYDDSFYQLLPYEEITKEEYTKRLKDLPKLDISQLSKYEIGEDFELDASDCSSGSCPVR